MNKKEAREWILNNCFTKCGNKINPMACRKSFWDKHIDVYDLLPVHYDSISSNIICFLNDKEFFSCIICGKTLKNNTLYCGASCQNKDPRNRSFVDAWSDETRAKRAKTNIKKYGSISPFGNKEIQEKTKKTNRERYGADSVFSKDSLLIGEIHSIQEKLYGGVGFKSNVILKKTHETQEELYGGVGLKSDEILENAHREKNKLCPFANMLPEEMERLIISKGVMQLAEEYNAHYSSVYIAIARLGLSEKLLRSCESSFQNEVCSFIESMYPNATIKNARVLDNKHIDIFIPAKSIGFECNGIYWHSEKYKDKNYHSWKSKKARDSRIRLIHIFEDEWYLKKDIIKNKIKYLLGVGEKPIYARNTECKPINKTDAINFIEKYHIQGKGKSTLNYGLFYCGSLVSVMTFRKDKNNFVLDRFCSSIPVQGGFSKLLTHFTRNNDYEKIFSFLDIASNGYHSSVYHSVGFVESYRLKPDYKYVMNGKRVHKFNFRHKNLAKMLKVYDPNISEHKNCLINNIYKIYDSGKIKYEYNNPLRR